MKNKLTTQDVIGIANRAKRIMIYQDAGLLYPWYLGYNHLINKKDLESALVNRLELNK